MRVFVISPTAKTLSASSAHRASIFYLRASTQSGHFLPAILVYITPRAYVMQPNGLYFPMAFSLRLTGPLELSQIWERFIEDHGKQTHGTSAGIARAGL
jgi:hypothetical protein